MIDEQMVEKTAFMSEVFSTDDELDASEDNLDDTKENRKKEKKRKRSGSFQGECFHMFLPSFKQLKKFLEQAEIFCNLLYKFGSDGTCLILIISNQCLIKFS